MLIVVSGLPGVGKSAVAQAVARRLAAVHLSIDVVEDAMLGAGCPPGFTTGVAAYEAVRAAAEQNLGVGRVVVVDAVNDSEPARETWRRAAAAGGAPLVLAVLEPPDPDVHERRLVDRVRPFRHLPEPAWSDVVAAVAAYPPWTDPGVLRLRADEPVDRLAGRVIAEAGLG